MPGFRAHLLFGAITFAGVLSVCAHHIHEPWSIAIGCAATLFGALLPDCDTRSKGRQLMHTITVPLLIVLCMYQAYFLACLLLVFNITTHCVPHRGPTHTLWFPFVYLAIVGLYAYHRGLPVHTMGWVVTCFFVGYGSHIILDRYAR